MTKFSIVGAVAALLIAPSAFAASDLVVSVDAPSAVVYDVGTWNITVSNVGNRNADNSSVVIQLPETNTSPQVYVLGIVDSFKRGCSQSGTVITCSLGKIRKNKSKSVWVDMASPVSSAAITVVATAATQSNENSTSNNSGSGNASLSYYSTPISGQNTMVNRHCTGQGLTAFYECTLFPSSISSHTAVLEGNNTITIPGQPTFGGTWSQPTTDALVFEYTDNGTPVANFSGYGVGGNCFEGLTTFPNSAWVAPYEVCL